MNAVPASFPTKTAQQDALADLNRAYEAAREEINKRCLSVMHADTATPAGVEELYWALPHDLHNYRAKHGALAVSVFPEVAPTIARIEELFTLRNALKAVPVVKVVKADRADPAVVAAADKTQTRGNCPCCGREQAVLASGTMSKHGYTVEHGWFNGVCSGDAFAPMQVQREVTDNIVEQVRNDAAKLVVKAGQLRSGATILGQIAKPNEYVRHGQQPTMVEWKDLPEHARKQALDIAVCQLESRARAGYSFATDMENLVNRVHGQPLKVVAV